MDKDVIDTIKKTYYQIQRLRQENINPRRVKVLLQELSYMRSISTFYAEYEPWDNINLLGETFFKEMKQNLTPLLFRTSILNQRIRKLENGFYSSLNEKIHYYDNYNLGYLESFNYDTTKALEADCRQDGDMEWDKPLYIACDYNAHINWIVVGQPDYGKRTIKILKSMYVKGEKRFSALLDDFHNYYKIRTERGLVYYYTNTALQGAYAINGETFNSFIQEKLTEMGWTVMPQYLGQAPSHDLKHRYINDGLKGINNLFPTFNKDNNEELLIAMEQTGVRIGERGFKKDKSEEKNPETPEDPLELRTDGTDAFDELYMGCVLQPIEFTISSSPGIIGTTHQ
jgi:hypothetical protein